MQKRKTGGDGLCTVITWYAITLRDTNSKERKMQ